MLTVTYEWQCDLCPAQERDRFAMSYMEPPIQYPIANRPGGWSVIMERGRTLVLCPAHRVEVT